MKRVKACPNSECSQFHEKHFKEIENYCSQCGAKLYYACKEKDCYQHLPEDSLDAYCAPHLAEWEIKKAERTEKIIDVGSKIFMGLLIVGVATKGVLEAFKQK